MWNGEEGPALDQAEKGNHVAFRRPTFRRPGREGQAQGVVRREQEVAAAGTAG